MDPFLAIMASSSRTWDNIADDLRGLGLDPDDPKLASHLCGPDGSSWLTQFEGTPLLTQALELVETELALEGESLRRRRESDQHDIYTQQDGLRLAKSKLELELVRSRTAPTTPVDPPQTSTVKIEAAGEKMPPPPAPPAQEGGLKQAASGEIAYGGSYNTGESGTPVWPMAAMGDGAGRRETKEERAARMMTPPSAVVEPGPGSNPKLAGLLVHGLPMAAMGTLGAVTGGIAGASSADPGHRLSGAAQGAVGGGALGALGGAMAGHGISGAARKVMARANDPAVQKIMQEGMAHLERGDHAAAQAAFASIKPPSVGGHMALTGLGLAGGAAAPIAGGAIAGRQASPAPADPKLAYFREHAEREAKREREDEKALTEHFTSGASHIPQTTATGAVLGAIPGHLIGHALKGPVGGLAGGLAGGVIGGLGGAYLGHQAGKGRRAALKMMAAGEAPDENTPFWTELGHQVISNAGEDARVNRHYNTLGATGGGRVVGEGLGGALLGATPGLLASVAAPHVGIPLAAAGGLAGGLAGAWHGHRSAKARKEVEAEQGWAPEQAEDEVRRWERKNASLRVAVEGLRGLPFTSSPISPK